jgi:hypothetical protein
VGLLARDARLDCATQTPIRERQGDFVDGNALQLTLRQVRGVFTDLRALGVMAIVGVLLGFAGPFGTFETLPVAGRVVYWVAIVFLTYGSGFGLALLGDGLWGKGRPVWLRVVIQIATAGLGTSVVVALVNLVVFGTSNLDAWGIAAVVAQSFAVSAAVVAVSFLASRPDPTRSPAGPPPILERVPLGQRGALLALSVEDHYVDIVTERGKTLVLMRLADAMREADGVPGLQIHRSHWVASAAVVKAHRSEGKVTLELTNGMRLPVSRGYLPAAKEAGLV